MDQLGEEQLTDDVKSQYAALDKAYMEQAVWAPYGNEEYTTFVSDRLNFDKAYSQLLFNQDYTAFQVK
jgi:peptide/nickel transport system substrate-binding protein